MQTNYKVLGYLFTREIDGKAHYLSESRFWQPLTELSAVTLHQSSFYQELVNKILAGQVKPDEIPHNFHIVGRREDNKIDFGPKIPFCPDVMDPALEHPFHDISP